MLLCELAVVAYEGYMRRGLTFLLALAALAAAGCYDPDVKNGGYSCTADRPHCPSGFTCVGNRCVNDGSQPPPGQDSGPPPVGDDLSTSGPVVDMTSTVSTDMAGQQSMPDMSKPSRPDMAQGPMCGASGSGCSVNSDCCSDSCTWYIFFSLCD
jgi:hypothetical protein